MKKTNLLIVGSNISAQCLIEKIIKLENCGNIFVVGTKFLTNFDINFVDIRQDRVDEILEFAVQNSIDLTIVTSKEAIKSDIAGLFAANGQMIFAPDEACAKTLLDDGIMKKMLYKLKIPTTKFGIFEKSQAAYEYIKTANFPLTIQATMPKNERDIFACPTTSVATIAINDLFFKNFDKILIEEYKTGHRFTLWALTDGFKILPIGCCRNEIFSDCPDGGYLTFCSASVLPDNRIEKATQDYILSNILEPIISVFQKNGTPYLGFIGARCVLNNNELYVEKIYTLLEETQAQAIINLIDENLINLFNACAIGSFADDYNEIKTNATATVSVSLYSRNEEKEIQIPEILDDGCNIKLSTKLFNNKYYTQKGYIGTASGHANTLNKAKQNLFELLSDLKNESLKYRKDIVTPS